MAAHVPTPLLVIHANLVHQNLARLSSYAQEHELSLRPSATVHGSVQLARLQMEHDGIGLAVTHAAEAAKLSPAADDFLVAYPVLAPDAMRQLAQLAMHTTVRVAVDSVAKVDALAAAARTKATTIGALVHVDVGFHRGGVPSPGAALGLAERIDKAAGLRLDGIFCDPGHIECPPDSQEPELLQVSELLGETLFLWDQHGLEAAIVSGGSTATAYQSHLVAEYSEIHPGRYIFGDLAAVRSGVCALTDCAAHVVATVLADAGQVTIDAGSVALGAQRLTASPESGFGYVLEYPQARIIQLTDERGMLDTRECPTRPQAGERITIIPNRIDQCLLTPERRYWQEVDGSCRPLLS